VSELLEEALASGQLELEEGGTGKLRMVEIISNKILAICRPEAVLESVSSTGVSFTHLERNEEVIWREILKMSDFCLWGQAKGRERNLPPCSRQLGQVV
jgi:hypothetical protein